MDTYLKRLNQFLLTLFAGMLFWMGLATVNHAAAFAAPPGAENTPRTSLEFRHNKTRDIMQGAAQDRVAPNQEMQNGQNKLENAADTVRRKLNLDEPIAPETKEFMRDVKGRVDSTVAPMTGDRTGGYYSTPRR